MATNSKDYMNKWREEHREQYNDYMRRWREEHRKEANEFSRRWREKNKDYFSNYYAEHKEEMHQRYNDYINKFKGYYLYIIINAENKILYVGETTNIKRRFYNHLTCNSNISEYMKQDEWKYVKYLDISNLVENENELRLLENELIELYQPAWNKTKNIVKEIEEERKFELLCNLHSLENVWEIYATNPD